MTYRLPAEWEPQSGVMLTWPHQESTWWDPWRTELNQSFAAMSAAISHYEHVLINYLDAEHREQIESLLQQEQANPNHIRFYLVPGDDVWARDHGPITLVNNSGRFKLLDFTFNGWGGKYGASRDNQITATLFQHGAFQNAERERIEWVLEGGGIESDGQGTLLTTSRCLLGRNAGYQEKAQVEAKLREHLGVERVLWLDHGYIAGDDTDGHIDTLARFADPETICYVTCYEPADEHYSALKSMERELENFRTQTGRPYRLVPLPLPQPVHANRDDYRRLPATYANFLVINGAVLLPTYADPMDRLARQQMRECFPNHDIISIHSTPIIQQYGSLHCVTMQLPQGVLV